MPHVIIKIVGQSELQKHSLADAIAKTLVSTLNIDESFISIAIEDVTGDEWVEKVYLPDIKNGKVKVYKQPGYDPL